MRALISARIQIQMADKSLQLAELRIDKYRKNNLACTATVQDVIDAENDLTSARNTQMDATETFANGVAKLWRDMGVLLDRQGVHIDTAQPKKNLETVQEPPSPAAASPAP
jgi:outer membrane protein TolC